MIRKKFSIGLKKSIAGFQTALCTRAKIRTQFGPNFEPSLFKITPVMEIIVELFRSYLRVHT